MKRLKNIERNKKELERLGLVKASSKRMDDKVDGEETGQEFASSSGALPTRCIGKYSYQLTASDLQKEQQAFEAGEGVRITHTLYAKQLI